MCTKTFVTLITAYEIQLNKLDKVLSNLMYILHFSEHLSIGS